MFNIRYLLPALCMVLSCMVAGCKPGESSDMTPSVRVVDIQQVLVKSGLASQEAAHLNAVRQSLNDALTLGAKQYTALSEEKQKEARKSDAILVAQQWEHERMQARQAVSLILQKAINDWRIKNGISAVITRQAVLSVDDKLDITPDIIRSLNKVEVKFGKLPEFSLKKKSTDVRGGMKDEKGVDKK
jgi:Skp family chaperone for outer membrane proteins